MFCTDFSAMLAQGFWALMRTLQGRRRLTLLKTGATLGDRLTCLLRWPVRSRSTFRN